MNILLVEDNQAIIMGLKHAFEKNQYCLTYKTNLRETREYLGKNPAVDLAILDVMLPDGDGFHLYETTLKGKNIPVIFLTARDDEDDIVNGLNMGAEDYLTKPFSTKELLARMNKILLRREKKSVITVRDICFDMEKMAVYKENRNIELTSLELKILHLLFVNLGRAVSRTIILDKIWEWTGNDVDRHTVTVYMKRIREKLGTDIITTIKGIGYRIDDEK
ncbi:MAG: response regulator transcription factor [Lachnospiraceae bacterium]|nr:response regulator transcription factor [Lachnospiraceae bacterium]